MKKLKNFKTDLPCICCGHCVENENCLHHLLTRKVYPEFQFDHWNLVPLCQHCHNEFHLKGTVYMANAFPAVEKWLIDNEWFYCDVVKKYRRQGF